MDNDEVKRHDSVSVASAASSISPAPFPTPAQLQNPQRVYVHASGQQISEDNFHLLLSRATMAKSRGKLLETHAHELLWMLSQHHPDHQAVVGTRRDPPARTAPKILQWFKQVGPGGGLWVNGNARERQQVGRQKGEQQQISQSQRMAQPQANQHAGQQQQTKNNGQSIWPNYSSPNMGPGGMGQDGRQRVGQTSPQQSWLNRSPNIIPSQYGIGFQIAPAGQSPMGMTLDPALANDARPTIANSMGHTVQDGVICAQSTSLQSSGYPPHHGVRPSSLVSHGQIVQPASSPSPSDINQIQTDRPLTTSSHLSPTLTSYQTANGKRPGLSRKGSCPEMGMFAPPPVRSPSVQGDISLQQKRSAQPKLNKGGRIVDDAKRGAQPESGLKQRFTFDDLTNEQIRRLTPKQAKKYEWIRNMREEAKMHQAAAAAAAKTMKPPPRPTRNSNEVIDLTGTSKRKTPPTSSEIQSNHKKPYIINDYAAFRANQVLLQAQEPNCGFGPSTTVIRSNLNSRQPTRQTSPQPAFQNLPKAIEIQPTPPPTDVADEDLYTHALTHGVHLSDLDFNSNIALMLAQRALHYADLKKRRECIGSKRFNQVGNPNVPKQTPNVHGPAKVSADTSIAFAYEIVRAGDYDYGRDDEPVHRDGDVVEGCTKDADGSLRAVDLGMSEERADVMWGLYLAARG